MIEPSQGAFFKDSSRDFKIPPPGELGPALLEYLGTLTVPHGPDKGQPLELWPHQRDFVERTWAIDAELEDAYAVLCAPRKNGKTPLVSALAAAAIDGPLREPRGEVLVVSAGFKQARLVIRDVAAYLGPKLRNANEWRVLNSSQHALIEHRPTEAVVQAVGSDPSQLPGFRASLVIIDEPASQKLTKAEQIWEVLSTTAGAADKFRLLMIGTAVAAHQDTHYFERMRGEADVVLDYRGDPKAPLFDEHGEIAGHVKRANPAWAFSAPLRRAIRKEAQLAARDSTQRRVFNSLRLNLGSEQVGRDLLCDTETLAAIEADPDAPPERSGPAFWGIDIGASKSLSATTCYWPESGFVDYVIAVPKIPGLPERGEQDGVGTDYEAMYRDGDLIRSGERVIDLPAFLRECLDRFGPTLPAAIAADRFKQAELLDAMSEVGIPADRLHPRGMGWATATQDVAAFREAAISRVIAIRPSFAMRHAMGAATVAESPTGDWKLIKQRKGHGAKTGARDDLAAATVLGVSLGFRLTRSDRGSASMAGHGGPLENGEIEHEHEDEEEPIHQLIV
ncbi:MAG: hypothetical protein F4X02_12595 [Chloroflexi bacterium]|nr:hypothetical protein [Chloroflexota bacterium]